MSNSPYKDSRWQRKRLEIMERDNWTCQSCGATSEDENGTFLNVHHAFYEKGKKPWEYPDNALITWCEECHGVIHDRLQTIQQCFTKLTDQDINGLCEFVEACAENSAPLKFWNANGIHFDLKELYDVMLVLDRTYFKGADDKSGELQ